MPVVLLVDDEESLRKVLAKALAKEGIEVIAVPSALHAVRVLERVVVDVVVTDYRMNGPNGVVLLETVRDGWPDVGRILISGYLTPEARNSPAVDSAFDKAEDAAFLIDSIVEAAKRRHGKRRRGSARSG